MIKVDNIFIGGFVPALRSIRNSYASWNKADNEYITDKFITEIDYGNIPLLAIRYDGVIFGDNDYKLAERLIRAGEPHCKFRRMIVVWMDITAPLYWWKQFDTYKIGTVANSESTMHNICDHEFTNEDFSITDTVKRSEAFQSTLIFLNSLRRMYNSTKEKRYFDDIISALPESYNQRRSVMLNYSVLAAIYKQRKGHKLQEWKDFCDIIEMFPHAWIFTTNKSGYTEWLEDARQKAKELRENGKTVKEIADEFGVSEAIIINWITGEGLNNGGDNKSE